MSRDALTRQAPAPQEVERAMSDFSSIAANLRDSYAALAARAAVVEEELRVVNLDLETKVFELERAHRHLEAVLDSLPTGVVVRAEDGSIERVNSAAVEILGEARADLVGRERAPLETDAAGSEIVARDGTRRMVAARYSAVRTGDGESLGSVEILDDRTEYHAMAGRMHRLDKMAALGTMAGGIAHEIRNPMNAMKGFAALLLRGMDAEQSPKEARWAQRICDGVDEVNAIVSGLFHFASPERMAPETLDGALLVADAIELVRRDLAAGGATDRWQVSHNVLATELVGDRIMLRQALRNLIANGLDAQPEGGRVEVSLEDDGNVATFYVDDAGPGIPAELADRVTDPFFTTRSEGTGLGLALVHTVAALHGGRFEVAHRASALGGARVQLEIPRLSDPTP